MAEPKKSDSVGQTNGKLASLFRFNQYAAPIYGSLITAAFGMLIWMVSSVSANNFSRANVSELRSQLNSLAERHDRDMEIIFENMPPKSWQARIEKRIENLELGIKENNVAHTEILVMLGRINEQLEQLKRK